MRVGTICYATDQGLGILAKAFYDHGVVTDAIVIKHYYRPTRTNWFPHAPIINAKPLNVNVLREFVRKMDVMLFFETPFEWSLLPYCREVRTKTVLMPMYENMPIALPYQPDAFINPSLLDQKHFPDHSIFLPVPVDTPWKQRTRVTTFVHNAGHGGAKGRNGTAELLEAWRHHVKSPAKLIFRSQKAFGDLICRNITICRGTVPHNHLYDQGDAFIFPEKHNGLSLPLQEARAAGMLVVATDRFPINTWLPREPLIPVLRYDTSRVSRRTLDFDEAVIEPSSIADRIDNLYGTDIKAYSLSGKEWAAQMSWDVLKPKYLAVLSTL